MPYIDKSRRPEILTTWSDNPGIPILDVKTPGELNYIFTDIICTYIRSKGLSYQCINDIVGALEGCKLEFYRRIAVPYEDKAIEHNGDVYD